MSYAVCEGDEASKSTYHDPKIRDLFDRRGDLLLTNAAPVPEHDAAYPDKADRRCGFLAALSAEICGSW
jgi:hypothetical protein